MHPLRLRFLLCLAACWSCWLTPAVAQTPLDRAFAHADAAVVDGDVSALLDRSLAAVEMALADTTSAEELQPATPELAIALSRATYAATSAAEWTRALPVLQAATADRVEPLLAANARWRLGLGVLTTTGELASAREAWQSLGLLEAWRVIGPFDNERGGGFAEPYPPETELDLEGTYDGKKRPVSWRALPVTPLAGLVNLDALFEPDDEALAYALTFVASETEQTLALRVGSDEGYAAWVNGRLIASDDVERSMRFDQTAVRLPLRAGWNAILLKVAEAKGSWQFRARITALDGRPASGWREAVLDEQLGAAAIAELAGLVKAATLERADDEEPFAEGPAPALGAIDIVRARIAANDDASKSGDARAHYLLGSLLNRRGAHDVDEHPDTDAVRRAIEIDDTPALYHMLLAKTLRHQTAVAAQRDDNQWREALTAAAERGSAQACLDLAGYYLSTFRNVRRATHWADRATALNPDSTDLRILRQRIARRRGFPSSGREETRLLVAREPRSPRALRALAARQRGDGRNAEAIATLEGLLARSRADAGTRAALVAVYLDAGRIDSAHRTLEAGRVFEPFGVGTMRRLADLALGRDEHDDAIAHYEETLRICPENHDVLEQLGRVQWSLDRRSVAFAAWDRALQLQPHLPDLRERLEFLRAQESPFETEFRRDGAAIAKAAIDAGHESETGEAARILLDNHVIEVNQDGTTRQYHQLLFHVLNDLGIRMFNSYATNYSDGEQVVEFKTARVWHADGTSDDARLRRYGGNNIGGTARWRRAGVDLPPVAVGDVVEIEYVGEDVVQSFFGDYFGHRELFRSSQAIAEKVFRLRVPAGRQFHFHQRHLDVEPLKSVDDEAKTVTYTWVVRDVAKVDQEPGMPPATEIFPRLDVSTFADWNEFSYWYWNLIRKQFESSPELEKKVAELTSGKDTDLAKIRALYNFVVTDIRYNAWEFGVHGFKPYNASKVFARRFGDCKDKATLLCVMLGLVDIDAHPVIIHASSSRGEEDLTLPMVNHFNHCITYLPAADGRPEMYLDGTATFHSVEELPSMDAGARVLVVRDDGGSVQDIPWNSATDLAVDEDWTVTFKPGAGGKLAEDSPAEIRIRMTATGGFAVSLRRSFEVEAQRQKNLEQIFGRRFAGAEIVAQSFSALADLDEPVSFSVTLSVPKLLTATPEGLSLSLPTDFFQVVDSLSLLGAQDDRQFDVILSNPRRSRLRAAFAFPEGTKVRSLPESRREEARFGRFDLVIARTDDGNVTIDRLAELTAPRVALADYERLRALTASIDQLDNDKIILER